MVRVQPFTLLATVVMYIYSFWYPSLSDNSVRHWQHYCDLSLSQCFTHIIPNVAISGNSNRQLNRLSFFHGMPIPAAKFFRRCVDVRQTVPITANHWQDRARKLIDNRLWAWMYQFVTSFQRIFVCERLIAQITNP